MSILGSFLEHNRTGYRALELIGKQKKNIIRMSLIVTHTVYYTAALTLYCNLIQPHSP